MSMGCAAVGKGGMAGDSTGGQHTSGPFELLIGVEAHTSCCMGKGAGMAVSLGQFGNSAVVGDHGNLGWWCGHGKGRPLLTASQLSCRKKKAHGHCMHIRITICSIHEIV